MHYPPTKCGDDMSSGFYFRLLTYTYIRPCRAAERTTHAFDYIGLIGQKVKCEGRRKFALFSVHSCI